MITLSTRAWLVAGAVALVLLSSSYGLGYYKGAKRPSAPPATVVNRQAEKKEASEERSRSVRDVTGEQDILETRMQLPDVVLPDGTRRSQVRITRQVAAKKTVDATTHKETEVKVVERVVERKVEVPGPPGQCPPPLANPFAPARPRFSIGPTVGRNFDTDQTVYGAAAGMRVVGPIWLRVGADTNPSVQAGAEVQF